MHRPHAVVWGVFTHRQLRSHPLSSWTFWTFTPSWTLLTFFLLLLPPFCVHPTVWTITLHSIPKTSLRLCNASWYDWIFLFVCLLLIIGDDSLRYKSKKNKKKNQQHTKRKKKYTKKKEMQTNNNNKKKRNNCFSTISFFLSHCKYFCQIFVEL